MKDDTTGIPVQATSFDRDLLAQLVQIAIGGRKITEVMAQTGLSRSTISKLLNGNATSFPTTDTLLKLAGGTGPLFWKMLAASGSTSEQQEKLQRIRNLSQSFSAEHTPGHTPWSRHSALAAVLRSLERGGYGTAFSIDYLSEGIFAIDPVTEEPGPLLVFIPIVTTEQDPEAILKIAKDGLASAFTRWDISDNVYFLLTDSQAAFDLLSQLPNPTTRLAVARASDDGDTFCAQHVIPPFIKAYEVHGAFPVILNN